MIIIICDQGPHDFNVDPTDFTIKSVVGIAYKRMALAIIMHIFIYTSLNCMIETFCHTQNQRLNMSWRGRIQVWVNVLKV